MPRLLCALFLACWLPAAWAQNYSDLWWNPAESGWGLTISHHNDQLFVVLFIYDQDGAPTWVTIPGGNFTPDKRTFSGDVYRTTATPVGEPWNPSAVVSTKVGSATMVFQSESAATLTYSINGSIVTKSITRQVFGPFAPSYPFDSTELWWNPAESGWGFAIIEQGNVAFSVLYAHDARGQPTWYVGSRAERSIVGGAQKWLQYYWLTYATRGTSFNLPWNPSDLRVAPWVDGLGSQRQFFVEVPMNVPGADTELSAISPRPLWPSVRYLKRMSFGAPSTVPNKAVYAFPYPGNASANPGVVITARFGAAIREPINGAANTKGIYLFDGANPVPGYMRYKPHYGTEAQDIAHTLEFYPAVPLANGRTYRAQVIGQQSVDGRPVEPYEWSFTTRPFADFRGAPFIVQGVGLYAPIGLGTSAQRIVAVGNENLRPSRAWGVNAQGNIASAGEIAFGGNWFKRLPGNNGLMGLGTSYWGFGIIDRETMLPKTMLLPRANDDIQSSNYSCVAGLGKCYVTNVDFVKKEGWIDELDMATGQVVRQLKRADPASIYVNFGDISIVGSRLYTSANGINEYNSKEAIAFDLTSGLEAGKYLSRQVFGRLAVSATGDRVWFSLTRPNTDPNPGLRFIALDGATMALVRDVPGDGFDYLPIPQTRSLLTIKGKSINIYDGDSFQRLQSFVSSRQVIDLCIEQSGSRGWALVLPNTTETDIGVALITISGGRITDISVPIPIERSDLENPIGGSFQARIACLQ